jgi:hypothetical protein
MKRKFFGIFCFLALVGLVGAGQAISEEVCMDMGTITLKAPDDVEAVRSPVEFPHGVHFDYKCKECHHTWDGKTPVLNCTAAGCHDSSASLLKTEPEKAYRYYKNAYHDMCISCHKKIKAANEEIEMARKNIYTPLPKTGPTGCVQCHPKQ